VDQYRRELIIVLDKADPATSALEDRRFLCFLKAKFFADVCISPLQDGFMDNIPPPLI